YSEILTNEVDHKPIDIDDIDDMEFVILRFQLTSEWGEDTLKSVDINTSGSTDEGEGISLIKLYLDIDSDGVVGPRDEFLGQEILVSNDEILHIKLEHPLLLKQGVTNLLVTYDHSGGMQ
ncbi:MAG: hypothetical protein JKY67_02405, partial [Pseudomonadales bacterium]|nr:hypothetical protein [Pseudomonadales bacterium]